MYCCCMAMFYSYRNYGNVFFNFNKKYNNNEVKQSYIQSSTLLVSRNTHVHMHFSMTS